MNQAEARKYLEERAPAIARIMGSPDGKMLLEDLERVFYHCDLFGKTAEETAFNLGAREVVVYLRALHARTGA